MELTKKESRTLRKREQILNGNILKITLSIALPILFYNLCNYMYGIYDMMVVQSSGIGEAADIVVLDQIKNMISTVSWAIAGSGGILVARRVGENKITEARRCANCFFTLSLVLAAITLVFIPLGVPFLRLLKTDQTTIDSSMGYYYVQILTLVVTTINGCFISLEKSKGSTLHLLLLNIGVIIIKISLTSLFAYGPFKGVNTTWLAVATLIAQLFMFVSGLILCFRPSNILRIRIRELNFNKDDTKTLIILAIPMFVNEFLFCYGKVYINGEATTHYGKLVVGALGISNTIAGLMSNVISSFKDAGSTIVSQNYGNKNGKRIIEFFRKNVLYITIIALVGSIILFVLKEPIARFFAPNDKYEQEVIVNIFKWECLDIVFIGLSASANAIYYGFAKTKTTMALGLCTLFLYRIPTLLFLMHVVDMNYEACGIAMFVSNTLTGIVSFIAVVIFIVKLPKREKYKELFSYEVA